MSAASLSIGIADEEGLAGSTVRMPVTASGANGLSGLDFVLAYDPEVLTLVNVTSGSLSKGMMEANMSVPGLLSVSMADPEGMSGSGDVAVIMFSIIGTSGLTSDLILSNVQAFDTATQGEIPVTVTNSTFTVSPASGAGASPAASGGEALIVALFAFGLAAVASGIRGRYR